ncbi:VWA domain-containing protein [Streptomyces phaeochromogenes]|uniref:VWA domain-containing protein n=1 Tax=Streptomyces phaeochromogenes TaxID=1923 RepID=UPI002E2B9383|nr:VWA domain-containing protein [Streptomyces phaeochromogenes]
MRRHRQPPRQAAEPLSQAPPRTPATRPAQEDPRRHVTRAARSSLRKSDRLGNRAAVYLVIDRSHLMKDYITDGTVQRLSDRILSLWAHLDDHGKVPVGTASSPAECTPPREAACSAAPRASPTSHSARTRAAPPSCTTPWGTSRLPPPDNSGLPIR